MKRFHLMPFATPKGVYYKLTIQAGDKPKYKPMAQVWSQMVRFMKRRWYDRFPFRLQEPWIAWEIHAHSGNPQYGCWASDSLCGERMIDSLSAAYPDIQVNPAEKPPSINFSRPHAGARLLLQYDYALPLNVEYQGDLETHANLLELISQLEKEQSVICQFLIRPMYDHHVEGTFTRAIRDIKRDRGAPAGENQLYLQALQEKKRRMKAEVVIRILAFDQTTEAAERLADQCSKAFSWMEHAQFNRFLVREWWQTIKPLFRFEFSRRIFPIRLKKNAVVLGDHELSGLARVPALKQTAFINNHNMQLPLAPIEIRKCSEEEDKIYLGENFRGSIEYPIHLPIESITDNMVVFGRNGMGKTTFVLHWLLDFLQQRTDENRYGCTILDMDGTLADQLLTNLPKRLHPYVQAARFREWRFPFNPFDIDFPQSEYGYVGEILRRLDSEFWGPQVPDAFMMTNTALDLVDQGSLWNVQRVFEEPDYARAVFDRIPEDNERNRSLKEQLRKYIYSETGSVNWPKELIRSPSLTRLRLWNSGEMGQILNQRTDGFRWLQAINEGHIQILDLAGLTYEQKKFVVSKVLMIFEIFSYPREMKRMNGQHLPIHPVIIDEGAYFLANVMPNPYGYLRDMSHNRTPLILTATGMKDYLSPQMLDCLFRQSGNIVSFQVSPTDANLIVRGMKDKAGQVNPKDYQWIQPRHCYMRLAPKKDSVFVLKTPQLEFVKDEVKIKKLLQQSYDQAMVYEKERRGNGPRKPTPII
jgi:hypothetical protein